MWSGARLYIMNIEMINKSSDRWLQYNRNEKYGGGYDSIRERGPRGELFMGINPTHILQLLLLYITF
jgi:hypothetical protein